MVPREPYESDHRRSVSVTAVLAVIALLCPAAGSIDAPHDIPDTILDAAAMHLKSRVGEDFYLAYLRFNPQKSQFVEARDESLLSGRSDRRFAKAHYVLVFDFRMPQHGFVDHQVICITYVDGTLLDFRAVPDCVTDPRECRFPIDEARAREIAASEGLEPGIKEWEIRFFWNYGYLTYIWIVSNTLEEKPDYATGHNVVIDANSGDVYPATSWFAYH